MLIYFDVEGNSERILISYFSETRNNPEKPIVNVILITHKVTILKLEMIIFVWVEYGMCFE